MQGIDAGVDSIPACLKRGIFPKEWKESVIVPILEEGEDENLAKSHRPVSALNIGIGV